MYVLTGPLRTTAAILTALQVRPILVVKWYGKAVNLPLCILFVDLPSILYKTNTGKCQTNTAPWATSLGLWLTASGTGLCLAHFKLQLCCHAVTR